MDFSRICGKSRKDIIEQKKEVERKEPKQKEREKRNEKRRGREKAKRKGEEQEKRVEAIEKIRSKTETHRKKGRKPFFIVLQV